MPSLSLDDRLIWFAHCPKAGGTSIERLLVETFGARVGHLHWGWDLWFRRGGWRARDRPPCSPQHLTWADAERALGVPPDAVFALVRDPVARMESEHRWQRRRRRATPLGRAVALLPFGLWLRVMLALAARNPYAFDNHLRPQSDFVPEGAAVFRLEDGLQGALDWLAGIADLPGAEMPHALKGGRARAVAASEAARIASSFAADYARFGYARPPGRVPARGGVDFLADVLAATLAPLERRGWL